MHWQGRARATGTRLFVVYAVASLVPVVALGAVLADGIRQDARDRGLELGRAQAAVVGEMVVAPALQGSDLTSGLSTQEMARLQRATDLAIFRGSVERLRLRDFDGSVLFSDDGLVAPEVAPGGAPRTVADRAAEAAAVAGSAAFQVAASGDAHVTILDGDSPGIQVFQPVVGDASGRSVGVLEVVLPYAAIAAEVEEAKSRTYWRLGAGLAVLHLVLAGISWSSTRRLRRQAAESAHAALHDPLTGLPNRELFRQKAESAIRRSGGCAVALVDLDRFKEVNDTLGHHAGDQLLREVARRLAATVRAEDTVARLGGDEFGLLLPGIVDSAAALDLIHRVSEGLSAGLVLEGVPLTPEASFGIALHPADGDTLEELLTHADAAMYEGKRGTSAVVVYDRALTGAPSHHLSIQHDLRLAIERDELRLEYQPQVDLRTGRTATVEALLRWQHPSRGLLAPVEFLPAVEHTALMGPLTEWVVARAAADCAAWTVAGRDWVVAVNVSARNLHEPDFGGTVAQLAGQAGLRPGQMQIEVTETALPVDPDAAAAALATLAAYGFGTALDDFGVGYASLSHLRSLQLTEVKIDRAFVAGVAEAGEDREVVAALIQLAHGLGLSVCAEGVETVEAADWLRQVGCDKAQGYYFSRPVPWAYLAPDDHWSPGQPATDSRTKVMS